MKITKVCWYGTRHFNVLPALILLFERDSVIVQFKWLCRHAGVQVSFTGFTNTRMSEGRY